jgi:hypothetical protein
MDNVNRRSFLSYSVAGIAALGIRCGSAEKPDAQLVWKTSDWKLADFQTLVNNPAEVKQVCDVKQIEEGMFLKGIKNSLNGLHFGFGLPEAQVKIVAALHGPANLLNYDDYIWNKYKVGAWLNVSDPATAKPAIRNPFFSSRKEAYVSKSIDHEDSMYQDPSMRALQARGVRFLCCHTATEEQARSLIEHNNLDKKPEEIVEEMLAHTLPGVLVVASMAAAIALLQARGHYTYIAA